MFNSKDGALTFNLPKMRAMTVSALCIFLDISPNTWLAHRTREGFLPICSRVDEIIWTQKFQGAAAGLLNPSIFARDLGLADRSKLSGRDGGPIKADVTVTEMLLVAVPIPERDADGYAIKKSDQS